MKHILTLIILSFLGVVCQAEGWKAQRISGKECQNETNTWINYAKDIFLEETPKNAIVKIACDSKYWMWINGEMVVFEGQLKRGPNPNDTYYDEVDIAPFLRTGINRVAILLWYFGKDGFSHNSSGEAGLAFQCDAINLISDGSWYSKVDKAFDDTGRPKPNFRLPESNIKFDARVGDFNWVQLNGNLKGFGRAKVIGEAESAPWNKLVLRPIPQWKDFGVREYENKGEIPTQGAGDWIVCKLPYNCHITPILEVEAPAGEMIKMQTDNFDYMGLNVASVRAEYVTKEGAQQYESLGWMNGHVVKYFIPKGVKIKSLKYRETGFGCEFTGQFHCNDKFYNKLWDMAVRTLYVTMRDTYMDCPDRERAQWWGDMVNESGEAFYALSPSAATITEKGMLELINWQREDGTLYSPIPEGNWNKELPGQMLASIGYFGFWNYYMNTGDKETITKVYKGAKRYLDVWKLQANGTLVEREGDWYWGDWGKQVDKQLLFNAWYYLALQGYLNMSELLGEQGEYSRTSIELAEFKSAFNNVFWDGKGYRTSAYEGEYDDRAQALAVVSGLAEMNKYNRLLNIFKTSFLASPYMEKYVLEALFIMGEDEYGMERMKQRYDKMVNESPFTTLYENFGGGEDRDGFGTNNHAWSGGGLTILAQYVCGLYPIEPAWKTFRVKPQMGKLQFAQTGNETVSGRVDVKIQKSHSNFKIDLTVPVGTKALVYIPDNYRIINVGDVNVFAKKPINNELTSFEKKENAYNRFWLLEGVHSIIAE